MRNQEHAHAARHRAKPTKPYLGKFLVDVVDVVITSFYVPFVSLKGRAIV